MHECYAMQILKKKNTEPKNNGHKGQSNEVQGPCQKDSISSSLLHPKPFRCTMSIEVLITQDFVKDNQLRSPDH